MASEMLWPVRPSTRVDADRRVICATRPRHDEDAEQVMSMPADAPSARTTAMVSTTQLMPSRKQRDDVDDGERRDLHQRCQLQMRDQAASARGRR
jgi:hypothetical protein